MVQCTAMTFGYGKKKLFQNLSLGLEPGAVYGLLGLNGAGKTSLLKLFAGALRPDSGDILCYTHSPGKREAVFLADIAFVPEDPWLPPVKPAQWLNRYAIFRPAFDYKRFDELLSELSLDPDKLLTRYSYGQRKKFALAAAMASGARLLLLDEPTNGLDIPSKTQFRRMLAASAGAERTIIVSTHQVRDLESLIDPIIIVENGRILCKLTQETINAKLVSAHLAAIDVPGIIYAERNAVGWSALLDASYAEEHQPADIEQVFNAAICEPGRLLAVLNADVGVQVSLPPFVDKGILGAKEAIL